MKPAFALDLRDDAIGLLHRSGSTWQQVGGVAMDEPDLTGALSYLRATALGLSPRGITTKLVIPNDQILYTTVSAPGPDDESRRSQIRTALEGRTPYPVEDLVFDWSGTGDEVQVAVIARETLDEAEGFATRHRFNPIAFVAVPDEGSFAGEPWFGASALSVSLLSGGERVERDNHPVLDIRRNFEPDLPAEHEVLPPPVLVQPDLPPVEAASDQPDPPEAPTPVEDPAPPPEVTPEPPPETPPEPEPEAPQPTDPEPLPPAETGSQPGELLSQAIRPLREPAPAAMAEEAPIALDVAPEEEAAPRPSVIDPGIDDDVPPMPGWTPAMAFASRRTAEATAPAAARAARPAAAKPLAAERPASRPTTAPAARNGKAAVAKPGLGSLDAAIGKARKPADDLAAPAPASAPAAARPQTAKPATPTGLSGRAVAPPKKPRHLGLILTVVLLLFLALVAAWSSIFLASSDDPAQPQTEQTAATEPAAQPTAADEAAADQQDPALTQPAAEQTAEAAPAATPAEPSAPPAGGTQSAAAEPSAASQPAEQAQDEIFLATMDAAPQTPDPSALPDPEARGDSLPQSQAAPPPFGTTYQFDAQGMIKPTAEGIITPEGVTLISGKPPRLPEPRPAALAAAAPAPATPAAPAVEATPPAAAPPFPSDPALAGARPKARPATLATPAPGPAPGDGAALAPTDAAPPGQKPRARPAALAAAAPAASDAAAASIANLDQPASPLAIAISRRPAARPASVNRAVEAAVAEAASAPAIAAPEPEAAPKSQVKLASAAAPDPEPKGQPSAPEADSEPEVASAAPSIPTRASVAKQATLKNAFDLGKTNLIGVYGTPSKRYALVRTSSGNFKKVRPGDRIDGGKVVSISEDALRFQKGSRTVVLTLPKT